MRVLRDLWRAWRYGVTWPIMALLLATSVDAQTLPPSPQGLTAQFSSTCSAATCATWSVGNATSVTVSVSGAGSWTGTFYASSDGGNTYFAASVIRLSDRTTTQTVTDTGDGQYAITNSGLTHLQFRLTTWASGGANVWAIRGYGSPMASPFGSSGSGVGPFYAVDGTAAAPSYSFASQTNKGMFSGATDALYWSVAGTSGMGLFTTGLQIKSDQVLGWSSGAVGVGYDTILARDAANTLAQRNGTNAQAFRVYGTTTGSRYVALNHDGTNAGISTPSGSGHFYITTDGTARWLFNSSGHLVTVADNTYDIGASGATRPRTGYFGTSVVSPILQGSGTGVSVANVGANSCGTTAATIAGNQVSGVITIGETAGTQCRVTFSTAAPVARDCTVTDATTTIATRATAVSTTTHDFLGAFVAGDNVVYQCTVR